MLLALVTAACALRCDAGTYMPQRDVGEVPRNVRWLPMQEAPEGAHTLVPAPPAGRTRVVTGPLDLLGIRGPLVAANTAYELRAVWGGLLARFTTTARADHRPPSGGRLLGALRGQFASIVLVHAAVTDESRLFPIVESWAPAKPQDRKLSVGWSIVTTPGTSADLPMLIDVGDKALRSIDAVTGGAPATLVLQDKMERCGGSPPAGLHLAPPGPGNTLQIRTRWMDAAENMTSWSDVVFCNYTHAAWVGVPR